MEKINTKKRLLLDKGIQVKRFLVFMVTWIASNLSIPFWVVGHVHLSLNIYHDLIEILSSMGMNIIVAVGFWIEYKNSLKYIWK
jgi:hypothetical protein